MVRESCVHGETGRGKRTRDMGWLVGRPAKRVDFRVHPKGSGSMPETRGGCSENLRPAVNSYRTSYHTHARTRQDSGVHVH